MGKQLVTIEDKQYPCYQTMGALLRFKTETGHDVAEMQPGVSDLCTFIYCCIVSACKREGVTFGYSLMDFADAVTPEEMNSWATMIGGEAAEGQAEGKKKQ